MRMAPIGSYIFMLSPHLVNCLGRMRRCGLLGVGVAWLKCESMGNILIQTTTPSQR